MLVAAATLAGLALVPTTSHLADLQPAIRDLLLVAGTLIVGAGAALRLWAGLFIAGHKHRRLVTSGPYAIVRNPLYLGNLTGTAGICLLGGSPTAALVVMPCVAWIMALAVRSEEAKLMRCFGPRYADYRSQVPRFLARPRAVLALLTDPTVTAVSHRGLARELLRAMLMASLGLGAFALAMLPG